MKAPQIILALVAVMAGAGLYFLPITPIAEAAEDHQDSETPAVEYFIIDDLTEIKNSMDSVSLSRLSGWESAGATDSLIAMFDMMRKPVGSAYYSLQRAETTNSSDHWTEAGERFLLNAKYMGEEARKKSWFAQSRACFEKAVELAPEDLDIQVDLGVCLIEGASFLGTPPMEGIGILKNVEQKDPKNIKALINLGYFSIRSGQYDKAKERFDQVLKIDANYAEAYLYLADLHEKQKLYKKAVADLENYKSLISDQQKIKEVDSYISELSKNI